MLEELQKRVQQRTHKEIIKRVFNRLIQNSKHDIGCTCEVCQYVKTYIQQNKMWAMSSPDWKVHKALQPLKNKIKKLNYL